MIRFEKNKIVIEMETVTPDFYYWWMMRGLLHLMEAADKDRLCDSEDSLAAVCRLLQEMVPEEMQVKKMIGVKPE